MYILSLIISEKGLNWPWNASMVPKCKLLSNNYWRYILLHFKSFNWPLFMWNFSCYLYVIPFFGWISIFWLNISRRNILLRPFFHELPMNILSLIISEKRLFWPGNASVVLNTFRNANFFQITIGVIYYFISKASIGHFSCEILAAIYT